MKASEASGLTRKRIVGLVVIAVLLAVLAYIRFAPGSEAVTVPQGAKAGDLVLDTCSYATEDGDYAADCGTLVVAEDRTDPRSRLIALPVIRIRALSEQPREPIFRLEGGPGITNMTFRQASRYVADRDVVLVGYRGVDGSQRLDCPEVTSALGRSTDLLGENSFRAYGDALQACAGRFQAEGVDVTAYGLPQQADDLEAARIALGYERINLVSESAGTRTALIYAWRYPESTHRSIMIGVNPPGHFLWDSPTLNEQLERYAALCAADEGCRERTDDLVASISQTAADMPGHWLFLPINASNVSVYSFFGLMESTTEMAPFSSTVTLDAWLSAAEGDASGFWIVSFFAELSPMPFVWGQYAAAGSLDAQAAQDYFATTTPDTGFAYAASAFVWGGGVLGEAWPRARDAELYDEVQVSEVETLLIGGELDTSTPPQIATRELLPYLPNGHEFVLPEFGHSMTFWAEQPEAGALLINTFLDSGVVDGSLYTEQRLDFDVGVLSFPPMAKVVLGLMLGFLVVAAILLIWMTMRANQGRAFGSRTSVLLRTLSPVPLGLGGWFVAVVLLMTFWPGVFIGGQTVAVVAMGVPIGLGVYLAWVSRDAQHLGLAAAMAAGVIGAWIGFNAADGVVAILTALLGAAVTTNLALLVLDIAWDRSSNAARTLPVPTPERQRQVTL